LETLTPNTDAQWNEFNNALEAVKDGKSFEQVIDCFKKTALKD
jgi:hypothetical protein